jgi:hypothetical protein
VWSRHSPGTTDGLDGTTLILLGEAEASYCSSTLRSSGGDAVQAVESVGILAAGRRRYKMSRAEARPLQKSARRDKARV